MDNSTNLDKQNLIKLASQYFREGQWDKALSEHGKILAIDRNDPDSLAAVGDIYTKKRSVQLAFEFYLKAASSFLTQAHPDKAILIYQKITRLDLSKLSLDVRMDMSFFQSYVDIDEMLKDKRYEVAIVPLGRLLKLRPNDLMTQALLKNLGDQVDQITPSIIRYKTLGDSFLKNGILAKTRDMYRKIAEMDPQNLSALSDLAQLFHKQGHESEAKKEYLYLAEQFLAKEDLNRAVDFAQKAIELKSLEAGYILGLVHFKNQKWPEAKTEFEKLLRIKINHIGALTHLAKVFALSAQPEKAAETFRKALTVDKNNVQLLEAWVEFCIQTKDKETAISHLTVLLNNALADKHDERTAKFSRMMLQLEPALISARVQLIEALQTLGDLPGAADASRALAMIYEQQGQLNEAAQYLEKAARWSPSNTNNLKEPITNIEPNLSSQALPSSNVIEVKLEVSDHSESVDVFHFTEKTEEDPVDSQPSNVISLAAIIREAPVESQPAPSDPSLSDDIEGQMATASLCIEQGLLKAAIEIYQQIFKGKV